MNNTQSLLISISTVGPSAIKASGKQNLTIEGSDSLDSLMNYLNKKGANSSLNISRYDRLTL